MAPDATILHADLDAFYASVEQLLDPALRGRPVAVGGGVVLAASYEAKAWGVQGGMPGWRARRLCPDLVVVGGHFPEYRRLGDAVVEVLRSYTPAIERISIDEAFLDVTGSVHLFGPPIRIAEDIRRRVRTEVGLPISVGAATTKHLAKVASQVAKPDGTVVVPAGRERAFLDPLPVGLLWGVGPVTRERLASRGIATVGDLARHEPGALAHLLGTAAGTTLHALAHNTDPRRVEGRRRARSVGAQSALGRRTATDDLVRTTLGFLADRVATRLRAKGLAGRTVTVRVRFPGLRSVTRSRTLDRPIATTRTVAEVAGGLVASALGDGAREITLLAVSVSGLAPETDRQLELPLGLASERLRPGSASGVARSRVDEAVDGVRARFGREALGYARVALRSRVGVPDAFRELAEAE
jgi:DNA polymerase-4